MNALRSGHLSAEEELALLKAVLAGERERERLTNFTRARNREGETRMTPHGIGDASSVSD